MPPRFLLAHPPTGLLVREDRCQCRTDESMVGAHRPPMELASMAAVLRDRGAEVRLRDYPAEGLGAEEALEEVRAWRPDGAVLGMTGPSLEDDLEFARRLREAAPSCRIAARGGNFLSPEDAERALRGGADLVLHGETDLAGPELLGPPGSVLGASYLEDGRVVRTAPRPPVEDLDALPFPARELLRNELYAREDTGEPQATIQANRGCPHDCLFCAAPLVSGRRLRARSPGSVVAEMRDCRERFGIRDFHLRGDTLTLDSRWTLELCEAIRASGLGARWVCNARADSLDPDLLRAMRGAGCWGVSIGVESADPGVQARLRKPVDLGAVRRAVEACRREGVRSLLYFIVGSPWDSVETIRATARAARELSPDMAEFFYAYPLPGTGLERAARELGLLQGRAPGQSQTGPAFPTLHLSVEELVRERRRAIRTFLSSPRWWLRQLLGPGPRAGVGPGLRYLRRWLRLGTGVGGRPLARAPGGRPRGKL